MNTEFPIDFVVTWVNMNDNIWKANFSKYASDDFDKNSLSDARFRDYGLLKYWFRGVEKFAPWVNKIHFICNENTPEWLNIHNPKLNIVKHTDFIPREYLPTFNSVVIERYMHRIKDLTEHFVYFNDDFYIIRPVSIDRFFRSGLPCDISIFQYNPSWSQWYVTIKNNIRIINKHFNKRTILKRDYTKWFSDEYGNLRLHNRFFQFYNKFITLRIPHNAQPYLKSTFHDVWAHESDILLSTSGNRFRASTDLTPELFRTWQICQGNFEPYNTYKDTKMFPLMIKSKQAIEAIKQQKYTLVCLNDNIKISNYDETMRRICEAFDVILPEKSSFETY